MSCPLCVFTACGPWTQRLVYLLICMAQNSLNSLMPSGAIYMATNSSHHWFSSRLVSYVYIFSTFAAVSLILRITASCKAKYLLNHAFQHFSQIFPVSSISGGRNLFLLGRFKPAFNTVSSTKRKNDNDDDNDNNNDAGVHIRKLMSIFSPCAMLPQTNRLL